MAHTIRLNIILPSGKTFESTHESDSVLLGSGPSAVLRIDDAHVSSIHAVLKIGPDGGVTVIDLGSEAGTTVNGRRILEPAPVRPGDRVGLGPVQVVLGSAARPGANAQLGTSPARPKAHVLAADETTEESDGVSRKIVRLPSVDVREHDDPASSRPGRPARATQPRPSPRRAHTPPPVGSNLITAEQDLDLSVLDPKLPDENRPTSERRVLEISVRWGDQILDSVQVSEPREVTVAERRSKKADLHVEAPLPVEHFTIAVNQGGEAQIVIPAGAYLGLRRADGEIVRSIQLQPTDAPFPAQTYRLALHERLAFKVGTLTFVAQFVRGDVRMGRGSGLDWYFPRIFAISALVHVSVVVAAFITPESGPLAVDDLFKTQSRFANVLLKQEKEKPQKKLDLSGSKGGAKHKDEEGKFGKKDRPKKDALASKAGAPRVDPNKREKDRKIALNAGLLGMLKSASGAAVSNVFGPGGLGTGINNAMGGLRGTEMGDAGGAGGLGTRGSGSGGGGNSLGIGGLGTHGNGTGGYGNIDLGGRGKGATRIVPGKTVIQGSLSKEEIGRVIRRNLARFKYCYDKQLNSNPNLNGKVAVYFTIAPTGEVAQASVRETSMNDENVESCVIKVMRSLKFPRPRGGGIVVVTYPFVFAAT